MPDFADRLQSARRQAGLTQAEAAAAAGVSTRTWERWEGGESTPSSRKLPQIARALNVAPIRLAEDGDILVALRQVLRALQRIEQKLDRALGES